MLSYQHGYHAGCFADVIKHLTLSRLLNYMVMKEKALFYLETHAGRGLYDLKSTQSLKTDEHSQGISLIWSHKKEFSKLFNPYLQTISKANTHHELRFYPGSPLFALEMLRLQDRLFCSELHPREFEHLEALPRQGKRVFISHSDGMADMNALLPPPERRGLIFIDPSYEIKTEYRQVPKAIKNAYERFSTGVFCLWYPLINEQFHDQLLRGMKNSGVKSSLRIEFNLNNPKELGMKGCGLWIINPPYVLEEEMSLILQQLCKVFNPGKSSFIIDKHLPTLLRLEAGKKNVFLHQEK